jgi:riboflavin kinase / FMN adenylyltransferase
MKVFTDPERLSAMRSPIAMAAGFFDGLHRGHLRVIARTVREAAALGGNAWVLTFDPHPLKVLKPEIAPPLLTSNPHRLLLLRQLGLEGCLLLPFTRELAACEARAFVERLIADVPRLRVIVVGRNWRFGSGGRGTPELLARVGRAAGLRVVVVDPVRWEGSIVSSTRIRAEVARGNLRNAAGMLGRPFSILGTVGRGRTIGRTLGFPTANIEPQNEVLPPLGVYAVRARVGRKLWSGVLNFGVRPTFAPEAGSRPTIELHILGLRRDLYGRTIEVSFVRRIREEVRFRSPAELRQRIAADVGEAKRFLA